tara:strand:- start:197 stop:607 length:411 start_codon:yes stop_codon:yes gene_type:complete
MADVVTTNIIEDGARTAIMHFTNVSDGSGEAAVAKVDVSALSADPVSKGACTSVNIECIWYTTKGMGVQIFCDATTNVLAWELIADYGDTLDFSEFVGLPNNAAAGGKTGDILFTTTGASDTDTYSVVLKLKKNYG